MSRQKKKRQAIDRRAAEDAAAAAQRPRPVVRPPRPHKAFLLATVGLLVAWLALLAAMAIQS